MLHRRAHFADGTHHAVHVLGIGDAQVDDRVRVLLAQVRERRNHAVRKHLNRALLVPHHDGAQVDLFHRAADAVDARDVADADLILENQEESRDHVAHQILRAEADRQAGDPGAGENRQDVDRQLAQQHEHGDESDGDRHQAREDTAERRRAPLPLEVGFRVTPSELVLQMLDREVRRADDDEGAGDDDGEVHAVADQPVAEQPRVPARFADAEARQRERHARQRRDAVRQQHQRPDQLPRARLHRRAVLAAHDVERVEHAADNRLHDAHDDRGEHEQQHDHRDGRVLDVGHHRRCIFR